jgi:ubiquinone/menaquinone biosynthesis C-methylase UbiE
VLRIWDADEESFLASYRTRGASHVLVLKSLVQEVQGIMPVQCLVDVGCGWGRDLIHLTTIAKSVLGVDVCSFSLLMTKKLLEEQQVTKVQLALAQGEYLPLRPASVDAMNCSATVEHFPDPGLFLREASRCLSPNGWLFLYYPNRFSLLPETHTGIFGLGWLPKKWQQKVVAENRRQNWDTFLFSRRGFMRMLQSQFAARQVRISGIPEGVENFMFTSKFANMLGPLAKPLKVCLSLSRGIPGCERVMSFFAPVHFAAIVHR